MSFGDFAIAPSTTVTLCAGVPLSKDSEDTYYFASAASQASTIGGFAIPGATFSNLTYQRNMRNVIRVGMPMGSSGANSAMRANYCIFNNTAFEGKPIYCFVDKVDYVNNNTIDVYFTIDAMQTFMFDYTLRECLVEREHTLSDQFGANVVPEDLPVYDTVVNGVDEYFLTTGSGETKYNKAIYWIPSVDDISDPSEVEGQTINNIYTPAKVETWTTDIQANDNIGILLMTKRNIVAVTMVPPIIPDTTTVTSALKSHGVTMDSTFGTGQAAYTPKNKKMFTYPYNYLTVSNNSGTEKQYRWEWFAAGGLGNRTATFELYGALMPSPEMALVPANYRGIQKNYADMVTLTNFPTSPWSEDSFNTWWMANRNSYDASVTANNWNTALSTVSGALAGAAIGGMKGSAMAGPVGTIVGAGVGAVSGITSGILRNNQLNAQKADQKAAPDRVAGAASAGAVNEVLGNTGFTVFKMQIPVSLAMCIDNYFTMYGYATQRVKTPNRNVRPYYTYTKTQGCTVYGNIPAEFAREIEARYNNGVRFWVAGATIGDYSVDNSASA